MREFVDPERGMTRRRPSPEARSYPQRMHHDGVALAKHLAAGGWSRRRLFGASLVASMAAVFADVGATSSNADGFVEPCRANCNAADA